MTKLKELVEMFSAENSDDMCLIYDTIVEFETLVKWEGNKKLINQPLLSEYGDYIVREIYCFSKGNHDRSYLITISPKNEWDDEDD